MPRIPLALVPEPDDPLSIQVFADGAIGTDPVRFVIDTGARIWTVPLSSATRHLPSARRSTSRSAADVAIDGDDVIVPDIRVGELIARDVEADRTEPGAHRHPAIGMNVLGGHRCSFQLAAGVLDIGADPPPDADIRSHETSPLGLPFVTVTFQDVDVRACWDTGASRSAIDIGWAQRHPHLVTIGAPVSGHDGVGAELDVWEAEVAACSIGGIAFAPSPCVAIDLGPLHARIGHTIDVVVGVPIIEKANWWFDFPHQIWAVQSPGTMQDEQRAQPASSPTLRP